MTEYEQALRELEPLQPQATEVGEAEYDEFEFMNVVNDEDHPWYQVLRGVQTRVMLELETAFGTFGDPIERIDTYIKTHAVPTREKMHDIAYEWSDDEVTHAFISIMDAAYRTLIFSESRTVLEETVADHLDYYKKYLIWLQRGNGRISEDYAWNDEAILKDLEREVLFTGLSLEQALAYIAESPSPDVARAVKAVDSRRVLTINGLNQRESIIPKLQNVTKITPETNDLVTKIAARAAVSTRPLTEHSIGGSIIRSYINDKKPYKKTA